MQPISGESSQFTISLVQVSDMHWCYTDPAEFIEPQETIDGTPPFQETQPLFRQALHSAIREHSQHADKSILVLGGDNSYKMSKKIGDVYKVLLSELLIPTISLQVDGRPIFDSVIAVPGNHDVYTTRRIDKPDNKKKKKQTDQITPQVNQDILKDKFHKFKELLELIRSECKISVNYCSPFSEHPLTSYMWNGKSITLWAANSSHKCGVLDKAETDLRELQLKLQKLKSRSQELKSLKKLIAAGLEESEKFYDPGFIPKKEMDSCSQALANHDSDILRIAIFPHNNLPTVNDDLQKYRFLNSSRVNNFLLEKRFRLVLHGHQHRAEIAAYTKFKSSLNANVPYSSYLTDGFLAIGAPAFDFHPRLRGDDRGFNIINLQLSSTHDVCSVKVYRYLWQEEDRDFTESCSSHDIALKPIPDEKVQRIKALGDIHRIIFSDSSLRGIGRAVDTKDYLQNHAEYLRDKVDGFRGMKAIYALSVFTPTNWLHSKLTEFLYPLARKNIVRASKAAFEKRASKASESDSLLFRFSSPLLHAIETATNNAALLNIAELEKIKESFKIPYRQGYDFLSRISPKLSHFKSFSCFGQALREEEHESHSSIYLQEIKCRPHFHFGGTQNKKTEAINSLFEFPRITLWEVEDLDRPSVLDIIEFHELSGFPLFWLDPNQIIDVKGNPRPKIGYTSMIAPDNRRLEEQKAQEYFHRPDGDRQVNLQNAVEFIWEATRPKLWPLHKDQMGLESDQFNTLNGNNKALHEFIWLLGHPGICFAADAWFARQSGSRAWDTFHHNVYSNTFAG